MEAKEFHKQVLDKFTNNITDRVFLMIQNDHELMQDYLNLLKDKSRKNVNEQISKAIKDIELQNDDNKECDKPESTLIKSYTIFKNKTK